MSPGAKLTEYERARLKRIEDNAKFMQNLGVLETKKDLDRSIVVTSSRAAPRAQPKPRRQTTGIQTAVRVSGRVAAMPARPSYRDLDGEPSRDRQRRNYGVDRTPPHMRDYVSTKESEEAASSAMAAAEPLSNPWMLKRMLRSHVSGCFWMGLTSGFCKDHMPAEDCSVILEDSDGKQWDTIYKAEKTALSGGWRGYSIDHRLDAGDALVFEAVERTKLKVHIFRAADQPSAKGMAETEEEGGQEGGDYLYERSMYNVRPKVSGKRSSGSHGVKAEKKEKKKKFDEFEELEEESESEDSAEYKSEKESEEAEKEEEEEEGEEGRKEESGSEDDVIVLEVESDMALKSPSVKEGPSVGVRRLSLRQRTKRAMYGE